MSLWEPRLALPPSPFTVAEGAALLPTSPSQSLSLPSFHFFTQQLHLQCARWPCQVLRGQGGPDPGPVGVSPGGRAAETLRQFRRCGESAFFSRIKYELVSRTGS